MAEELKLWLDVLQAVQIMLGLVALFIGLWWFFQRRLLRPRANYSHKVTALKLLKAHILLHLEITIENKGDTLLIVDQGEVRVYQLKPWPDADLVVPLREGRSYLKNNQNEVDWQCVDRRMIHFPQGAVHLEPDETDSIALDIVIEATIELIMIYSFVRNKQSKTHGWQTRTLCNLQSAQ